MALIKNIFHIIFGIVLAACILAVNCSPVPAEGKFPYPENHWILKSGNFLQTYDLPLIIITVAVAEAAAEDSRDGRFYGGGLAAAQATAIASGSGGYGYPGYGGGNAFAAANAVASG